MVGSVASSSAWHPEGTQLLVTHCRGGHTNSAVGGACVSHFKTHTSTHVCPALDTLHLGIEWQGSWGQRVMHR